MASTEDDVILSHLAYGSGEGIRCGQGVGTCKGAVREQVASVGTAEEALAHHLGGTLRTHREHLYGRARMLLLEAQCLLQCLHVIGVDDDGQCRAVDGAIGIHSALSHAACVGHLLGKYDNV